MKKIVLSFGVILFALAFVFVTCKPKSPEELGGSAIKPLDPKPEAPAPNVTPAPEQPTILLSQLAFESQLTNEKGSMREARAMYATLQKESKDLPEMSTTRPSYVMSTKGIDICPCPAAMVNCPCPGNDSTAFVAQSSVKAIVAINDKKLVAKTMKGKDGISWDAFKLPLELKEGGEYKMTIKGQFTKEGGPKSFVIPLQVKEGKIYPKW